MASTPDYRPLQLYIGGEWLDSKGRNTQAIVNPSTEQVLGALPLANISDLDRALEESARAFPRWRRTLVSDRAKLLHKIADLLRERTSRIAELLVLEQGKPLGEASWEVGYCADVFDWYAEEARRCYGRVVPSRIAGGRSLVLREPVGPVAAFAPWNVPVVLTGNKIAASLAAGCSIVVKPAEETPAACLELARAVADAGTPHGLMNMVFGVPSDVSTHLITSPIVRKVAFTGSASVGKQIARLAADGLKRVTLELGGHAPVVVFDDADVQHAVNMTAAFKFFNAGQVCFAPTRFYLHERIHDEFVDLFSAVAKGIVVADGFDARSNMGPLANRRRVDAMEALTQNAVDAGAKLRIGGHKLENRGHFWSPTVLTDVPESAQIMNVEPFGPVAVTARFSNVDDVVRSANRLPYGLGAYVFTASSQVAGELTDALECGLVGINNCAVASVDSPFGGVKESGYGSEYASEGLDAFLVTKHVHQT